MKRTKSASLEKSLALGVAVMSGCLAVSSVATADPVLIVKPTPHNGQGQEAGRSADIAGDYSLMGAQMLGARFEDSGGAYLFENGNPVPRQTLRLNGPVTIDYHGYGIGGWGTVFQNSTTTACTFTTEQVNGSYLGDRVALSSKWAALASYNMGHNFTPPHEMANCAGQQGAVPVVFLAKRNTNASSAPFGSLKYAIDVPFRDRVQAMDVSDTDLVVVGDGQGAHVFSYDSGSDEWNYNTTLLFWKYLAPSAGQAGQVVSLDGDTLVIGNQQDSEIYVYRKQGNNWNYLTHYQSTSNPEFGRAVDVNEDLIAVAGQNGADFFGINGNSLDYINRIPGPVRYVAIGGEYAVGVEDGQDSFIWQYHHSPAEGGYYKSGGLGGVEVQWFANNLEMDGVRVVSGYRGYNTSSNGLVGSMVWDSVRPLFVGATTVDNAEGDRIWQNAPQLFNWRRNAGSTLSGSTGPSSGAGGSQHYYYVETSAGVGANDFGDTALLQSDIIPSEGTLGFDFHMYGADMGVLFVDVNEVNQSGQWTTAMTIDGQVASNRSTNWQHRVLNLDSFTGQIRLRFRYVAHGGFRGDVALDNIVIQRN